MANKPVYNFKVINLSVQKEIEKVTLPIAREIAVNKFNTDLNQFIDEIEKDPVSMEIKAENTVNNSKFIRGVGSRKYGGNLFSFIGFELGSDPVGQLVGMIKNTFKINKTAKLIDGSYQFKISAPSESTIKDANPFPDGSFGNRSWITGIEKGISNIAHYIRKLGYGRSEGGIQVEGEIDKTFVPKRDYFGTKYREFFKRLQS